jgi:type IV pilus assembly protein PilV
MRIGNRSGGCSGFNMPIDPTWHAQNRHGSGELHRFSRQGGFTLIEVLITIVIILIGLLGVAGLQARATNVELESYQRGQALSLAREMAARLSGSRGITTGYLNNAISSTDGSVYVGAGAGAADLSDGAGGCTPGAGVALAEAKYEMCQWQLALQGAAAKDVTAGNTLVGAMIGARGCLIRMDTTASAALADLYVVIVWQGIAQGKEPLGTVVGETASPASQCASGVNFGTGLRRGVSVRVLVPDLAKAA